MRVLYLYPKAIFKDPLCYNAPWNLVYFKLVCVIMLLTKNQFVMMCIYLCLYVILQFTPICTPVKAMGLFPMSIHIHFIQILFAYLFQRITGPEESF